MYWQVGTTKKDSKDYLVYNYFEISPRSHYSHTWYNSLTRKTIHPPKAEVTIKSVVAASEAAFVRWYEEHKQL